jgi:hypothetical protein
LACSTADPKGARSGEQAFHRSDFGCLGGLDVGQGEGVPKGAVQPQVWNSASDASDNSS